MKHPKARFLKGLLRGIGILLLAVVVLLYVVLPVGMGVAAVLPGRAPVGAPPQGFEPVTLQADDGVALRAWYRPPANGAVIILLHGAGGSRESVRPYADMLA